MSEVASAYPTAGGLYYWASRMKNKDWGWWTAWLNLIGQVVIVAGINTWSGADPMRLDGKVALITGAGSGMGRVAAQMFAAEGAKVVVAEFGEEAGAETIRLVTDAGGDATFVQADVSREDDARRMVEAAVERYRRLDVLYNNAGIMPEADHSVIDTDVDTWDRVMAVNLRGVFLGCKYAIPRMIEGGAGSVINVSSFVALLGCSVPQDAYTASKGAVLSLSRSLAVQFGPRGVRSSGSAGCRGGIGAVEAAVGPISRYVRRNAALSL